VPDTLLSTKLYIPRTRQRLVQRPRLIERLDAGLQRKLTLVSAPAGYGKTILITQWLLTLAGEETITPFPVHRVPRSQIAWLSLDKTDNDPHRFFSYLIVALQKIDPSIGVDIQPILETERGLPIEPLLAILVNDIAACGADSSPGQRFVLVLDDYHLIAEINIHKALDFLIDHIPPCLHLVILTRADPPMPLGRLRVQRELTEVREADLHFTLEETAAFLNDIMDLTLSIDDVEILEARTEGWIAGLQLAALALQSPSTLQDRADKHEVIATFSGNHRHLIDYMVDEVLSYQPDEVLTFLLYTSILERFNASLCDALLQIEDSSIEGSAASLTASSDILERLDRANLFLVPLDDERQWYRYHHLFADFLRQRLYETEPGIIPELFVRASQWYQSQGIVEQAIEYALTGNDLIRAARLLDANALGYLYNAEVSKIILWSSRIPKRVRCKYPLLCLVHAWALQFEFQLAAVEPELALAETHLLNPAGLPDALPAYLLTGLAQGVRAYTAYRKGEFEQAVELSLEALNELPEKGSVDLRALRSALALNAGRGYFDLGQMKAARQALVEVMPLCLESGNRYGALSCLIYLIQVEIACGALNQAHANGQKGLALIDEWSGGSGASMTRLSRVIAQLHQALGQTLYERNDLDGAATNLEKACRIYELEQSYLRYHYALLVEARQAQGDVDGALAYLKKLVRFIQRSGYSLSGIPAEATLAERYVLLSRLRPDLNYLFAEALTWAESSGLAPGDPFQPGQEYEYYVLAQILVAGGKPEEATPLLERLIRSAEGSCRWGHLIGYLSLQALTYHAQDRVDEALAHLSRALTLAEFEGYVRTFVDLGPPMRDLLQIAASRGMAPTYAPTLLIAFPTQLAGQKSPLHPYARPPLHPLEPLTDREAQILRLMAAQLTYQKIADELYLSVNTIKWYAKSIFGKLGVNSKVDAVTRAWELSLIY